MELWLVFEIDVLLLDCTCAMSYYQQTMTA